MKKNISTSGKGKANSHTKAANNNGRKSKAFAYKENASTSGEVYSFIHRLFMA